MKTSVWVNNSYACFMPIHTLYQIVSIKIGYNDREKHRSNQKIHSKSAKAR